MSRKMMALAVGAGLVMAVGTRASAESANGYPPHGGWGGRAGYGWVGPRYVGARWGGPVVTYHRVWVPGYWVVRPWGERCFIAGYWR